MAHEGKLRFIVSGALLLGACGDPTPGSAPNPAYPEELHTVPQVPEGTDPTPPGSAPNPVYPEDPIVPEENAIDEAEAEAAEVEDELLENGVVPTERVRLRPEAERRTTESTGRRLQYAPNPGPNRD